MHYPQLVHAARLSPAFFVWPVSTQYDGECFRVQKKASVVVMLHLCPVCDPVLFLWLLRLKPQIELIALSLANFHPLVLWHYPVVDGSLEESKLVGRERGGDDIKQIKEDTLT